MSGDDESIAMFSNCNPMRPERLESLLIGDESFSEKGTTPESGGGIRNLAGTWLDTHIPACSLLSTLSSPTIVLGECIDLSDGMAVQSYREAFRWRVY